VETQRDVALLTENDYWTFIAPPTAGLVAGLTAFTMWKDCCETNCKAWLVRRQAEVLRLEGPPALKRKRSPSPPEKQERHDDTQAERLWIPLYHLSELQVEQGNVTPWRAMASTKQRQDGGASHLRFPSTSIGCRSSKPS